MSETGAGSLGPAATVDVALADRLASYRHLRQQIERSILPLATSVDGLSFECQASLHQLSLRRGGYVVLETGAGNLLGQVTDLEVVSMTAAHEALAGPGSGVLVRLARGSGMVLHGDWRPFHEATIRPAESDEVASWFAASSPGRATLNVGELLLAPGVPANLDAGGLDRHTFMCGQSGSGKTYALGVLIERVLADTDLRVVILDPNSDYVGLSRIRGDADPQLATRYANVAGHVAVWGNHPSADHPLRLRFADLDQAVQAAILGLDPVGDREEYAVLTDLLRRQRDGQPLINEVNQLLETDAPGARELGLRAINLGVLDWAVWSPQLPSLVEELRNPTARCTVVDLGSLDTVPEQRIVAEAVLSTLWQLRASRTPCLIVVDEAHNICPADPPDAVTRLSADRAIQIAAEGRKYGLYLLTSTQRPHKMPENVVSQCDNLLLLRMNSRADLADLGRIFSFVPQGLLVGATSFRRGQALVAGKFLPHATYIQMGTRVSEEGGADLPATWASRGIPPEPAGQSVSS